MAIQSINVGSVADDGTGDSLRVAGGKINANFAELSASLASAGGGVSNFWTPQQSGVVPGIGVSAQQRLDNGTAFQAAIDYANANRLTLFVPYGDYEINYPGGLQVDGYSFRWIGSKRSHIWQYADNTPIITFGKRDTTSASETATQTIDGLSVRYGNVQPSTNTSSNAIVFSRVWMGDYRNFDVGEVNDLRENATLMYRGVYCTNGFFFSNTLTNIRIKHFHNTGLRWNVQGTGNTFRNIYISNGNLNQGIGTVSSCLSINANGAVLQDSVWDQVNCEWSNAYHAIDMVNARNQVFNSLHVEGVHLRANTAMFKMNSSCSVTFNGVTISDCQPTTANGKVFGMGWDSHAIVTTIGFEKFNQVTPVTINLVASDDGNEIRRALIKIESLKLNANVVLNNADLTTVGGTNDTSRPLKVLGGVLPMTPGLSTVGDVDTVVSGMSHRHTIRADSPLTANRSITLTNKYDLTGQPGATLGLPNGCEHRICRSSTATGAFTFTVNTSAAADGTSPTSLGTLEPGQFMDVVIEAGVWVVVGRGSLV